jgi:A/G-specific adenine glycosylase
MRLSPPQIREFHVALQRHYEKQGRHELPWRQTTDPYHIVVSELMLQQTQVPRVIPKYYEFLERFPNIAALATAPLATVLTTWQGLGYNRRAKYLWEAAKMVEGEFNGVFPTNTDDLMKLPGIGPNTAGAIAAYAFNQPVLFIETNIRTVYIHHFFADQTDITDTQIKELLAQTIDTQNPRIFYWSLMDYGSYLKSQGHQRNSQSKHYVRQSPFEGSRRQVRGKALRLLAKQGYTSAELLQKLNDPRAAAVLDDLLREGLIKRSRDVYHLA